MFRCWMTAFRAVEPVSAVAEGPARRAVARTSCWTQRWTYSVINWLRRRSNVDRRNYCQRSLTDNSRHFITRSVHLSRTKLAICCDDRRVTAKFGIKSQTEIPSCLEIPCENFLQHSVGYIKGSHVTMISFFRGLFAVLINASADRPLSAFKTWNHWHPYIICCMYIFGSEQRIVQK